MIGFVALEMVSIVLCVYRYVSINDMYLDLIIRVPKQTPQPAH